MTTILDGRKASAHLKEQLALEVEKLKANGHRAPHLCAILVGNDPASQTYVKNKEIACEKAGFSSTLLRLDENISQQELIKTIEDINNNSNIDGLIVQLPLPKHLDEELVTDTISPNKDVDGFHTVSTGLMVKGMDTYLPATPYGILKILEYYNIQTSGMDCVVIGRSNIVGRPMSILLSQNNKYGNCTVTLAHSRTKNLNEVVKRADLIIAAIGRPNFVTKEMVKEGAVVVDVGINRIEDKSRKSGSRLVGDVDFEGIKEKCAAITPVPGGVGPMTIGGLLENTMIAYKRSQNIPSTL